MLKKELAAMLDISPAMVSRLAKQGMPTDTAERAQRWRKRHLEPGRIKGSRFDPNTPPTRATKPEAPPPVSLATVAQQATVLNGALASETDFDPDFCPGRVEQLAPLRGMLRQLSDGASPRMPLRVWLALVDWVLSDESPARTATDLDSVLDPDEFAARACPACPTFGRHWLDLACDFRNFSITGLPGDEFDSRDAEVSAMFEECMKQDLSQAAAC